VWLPSYPPKDIDKNGCPAKGVSALALTPWKTGADRLLDQTKQLFWLALWHEGINDDVPKFHSATIASVSFSKLVSLLVPLAFVLYRILQRPTIGERIGGVLGLAAGLAPAVWLVAVRGVPVKVVVGYAGVFFIGSVLLKMAVYLGIMARYVLPRSSPALGGSLQGVLSATCELGAAALAFGVVFPHLTFVEALGFGAGAAAVEAVIVSVVENVHAGGPNASLVATQIAVMRESPPWVPALIGLADRGVATILHVACRGLVAVGIATERAWPITVAFVVFASADGFAMRCLRSGWEFGHAIVAARLYGALAMLAAVSVVALVIAA